MPGTESSQVQLTGYYPGVVGKIVELHATYYHEHWGFDASFETQVGRELSEFISNFEEKRDGFWVATLDEEFAGAVAIDGSRATGEGARLRWFIVHPRFQGKGVGKSLMRVAMDFSRKAGFKKVFLWTFEGLDPARSLYERVGFRLSKAQEVRQWGRQITEQMFQLEL